MDGAVETRTGGGRLQHVYALVSYEVVPTSAAVASWFGEVGGVAVYVEYHVAGGASYIGVGVSGGVVE